MAAQRRAIRFREWLLRGIALIFIVALLGLSAGVIWLLTPQVLLPEATAAMVSDQTVAVVPNEAEISFTPSVDTRNTALIVYPGAKLPVEGYAPLARSIAEHGFRVFLVPMPGNFALLAVERALAVQTAHADVAHWVIAGHSLGGVAAAQFAVQHPDSIQGLALWASFPSDDLSQRDLQVLSVWGALDSARDSMDSAQTRARLPADTRFVEIPGGNHEQFGYYTGQANDPVAEITRADQQAQIVAATVELLEAVEAAAGSRDLVRGTGLWLP